MHLPTRGCSISGDAWWNKLPMMETDFVEILTCSASLRAFLTTCGVHGLGLIRSRAGSTASWCFTIATTIVLEEYPDRFL